MRRFKKATALAMAFAMTFSMAACGKKTGDDGSTGDTEAVVETTEEITTEAFVDDGDWTITEEEIVENDRFTTVEGAELIGLDFEDGSAGKITTYVNGGSFDMAVEEGELACNITNTGAVEHGCQIYLDGFTMAQGCVYTMAFDVRSTLEREVEWRVQINGGDYHAYAKDRVKVGPESQHVSYEFTMEENSDPAPRFVVNMGALEGTDPVAEAHSIYFDNISLSVTDSSNAQIIEGAPLPIKVKVNQIGYAPDDVKTVITTSKDDNKFKIVDVDTDEVVYMQGYGDLIYDASVASNVKQGDFTALKTPGRYKVISAPSGESYEFSIGDGLYDDIYRDVVLMLYRQRCGTALDESIAGDFAHEACHADGAVVYGSASSATVDVSGGWHDAGDYGRYVVPGAKTVQDLLLAYEDYGYAADDIGIPESGNGTPDLLDEARYELEWMFKMQTEDGGVYHKVTGDVFPETVLAVDETAQMIVSPVSYAATADFAAVMAKASVVYKEFDGDFAAKCGEAAAKAFDYISKETPTGFENPEEIVTGEYPDSVLGDETLWSAAELYITTKDAKYLDALKAALDANYQLGLGWATIGSYAIYDLAKAEGIDADVQAAAKEKLLAKADEMLGKCEKEAFFMCQATSYPWGSNMSIANNGMFLLMANNISENPKYVEYAKKHRDYIFGVNGTGYCYVTGYGTLSPEHTHHRPSQVLGKTMPGMLVGGPDGNLEDPYAAAVLFGYAPALAYVDNEQSFSCNEITIYWNSPLIYLLTGLK